MAVDPHERTVETKEPIAKSFAGGRYVVRKVLGEGGQKLVFLVHDSALDRLCALALLRTEGLAEDDLQRLRREGQAMGRMGAHPHLVTVYDIGEEAGCPFVVCEYLPGGDLRQELARSGGRVSIARAIEIARDLCAALAHAAKKGIVHRDLKPANVWLDENGRAKLGDFGLALAPDRARLTATGAILGTPAYLAPEQGLSQPVDARTDLYSLGCVLHELVTGAPPFSGESAMALLYQHVHVPPPPASHSNPDVPRALERLLLRLLAKSPAERPASAEAVLEEIDRLGASPATPHVPEPAPKSPFVGRREEAQALAAALDRAIAGRGSLFVIAGEPGVGKTRLAQAIADRASSRGVRVLVGRAAEADGSPPYLPFVEALGAAVSEEGADAARRRAGRDASILGRILPPLANEPAPAAPPAAQDPDRYPLFQSVATFLRSLAAPTGLVLVLEDAQWADRPSLLMLQHLARQLSGARILVLLLYRDLEVDRRHPLAEVLAELRRDRLYERIALGRLPADDVRLLVGRGDAAAAPRDLVDLVVRETDGNPFFVLEIVRHLADEGRIRWVDGKWIVEGRVADLAVPEGVREVIARRIARLSERCARMLGVASAMRGAFGWELLVALSGEDEDQLLDLLDEALSAQILRERKEPGATRYEFSHALVRQALYADQSSPRRARMHRRIAEATERIHGHDLTPHLADLAYHFFEGGSTADLEKAVGYAAKAAERAMAVLAFEDAAEIGERTLLALERLPADAARRGRTLLGIGLARIQAGLVDLGQDACREAAEIGKRIGDAELMSEAALGYGSEFAPGIIDPLMVSQLQDAAAALGEGDGALRALVLARLAGAQQPAKDPHVPVEIARDAIAMARRLGDEVTLMRVIHRAYSAMQDFVEPTESVPLCREQVALAERHGAKVEALRAHLRLVFALFESGDAPGGLAEVAAYETAAADVRRPQHVWPARMMRSMEALMVGRFSDSERLSNEAREIGIAGGDPRADRCFRIHRIGLCRAAYREKEMTDTLIRFLDDFELFQQAQELIWLYRMEVAVQARQVDQVRALFKHWNRIDYWSQHDPNVGTWIAEAAWLIEKDIDCAVFHARLLPRVQELDSWGPFAMTCEGPYARPVALLETLLGRWDDANAHFAYALETCERFGLRPMAARTAWEWGESLRRRGDPEDRDRIRALFTTAKAIGEELGMPGLLERLAEAQ